MKMSEKMVAAINQQINREFYSAYLYLAMSNWLDAKNIHGAANWMMIQYREEMAHAEGLLQWLRKRGEQVKLLPIEEPTHEWPSVLAVFEQALAHEEFVSECICALAKQAENEGDFMTRGFLEWYIMEQAEEEENAMNNVDAIKFASEDLCALMKIDGGWAARSFSTPHIPHLD